MVKEEISDDVPRLQYPLTPDNWIVRFAKSVMQNVFIDPVVWVRENIATPYRKQYNWYHQEFRRVPTVDQCYEEDVLCMWEADQQYKRDKNVDSMILNILRSRWQDCNKYYGNKHDAIKYCVNVKEIYEREAANWFCKYGDLGIRHNSYRCLMKQKHRLIWERRHGPVGTGMKKKKYKLDGSVYYE